ncbi:hypothetical protein EZV73_22745 [Acidaminobacter sp. JC074]|uniref:AbiJ-NTD4 domain-containing protein n=1 Tax=Acidaminobacter sp. JC074 TaxID=2530199 RepID=UPI001F10C2EF|nr:hypothetical protein [Acidaminobacter sp. JC074]MCH4890419.1 hypothetical protein [Acidaminobacter sp. JC074]
MSKFSERQGLVQAQFIQYDEMNQHLRIRILNYINKQLNYFYDVEFENYKTVCDKIVADYFIAEVNDDYDQAKNYIRLECYNGDWYQVYDLLEYVFNLFNDHFMSMLVEIPDVMPPQMVYSYQDLVDNDNDHYLEKIKELKDEIEYLLEIENSAYRMISSQLVPISNQDEISTIVDASHTKYKSVNMHLEKAISFYSDRVNPDYKNSIKESISAVEAICKIITNKDNKTLAPALDIMEQQGIKIHKGLKEGFKNIYGFTSDKDGIRHAKINFTECPEEDARFMLVSCSAFINYLNVKNSKSKLDTIS